VKRSTNSNPDIATLRSGLVPQRERSNRAVTGKLGAALKGLLSILVGVALVPSAILLVQLWQTTIQGGWEEKTAANKPMVMASATGFEQSVQDPSDLEIVLSSPDTIQVNAAGETDFHLAIDATDALPSRSIVAVSGLPHGASFSEGRPYGTSGWSLRPDEIGDLQLRLPGKPSSASTLHIELLAADGAVLAQSETRLTIATALAEPKTWMTLQGNPFDQTAASSFVEPTPPMPSRKPTLKKPSVDVRTVKVVTIKPPKLRRPYDGAYALGEAAEAPAQWVEIVRAVNMHARAEQSSETVKVVEKGLKMRVTGRDKNWVQVSDPATSSNGWIYSPFLKPTEPPEH
jgi:Bacterial SH3 domain